MGNLRSKDDAPDLHPLSKVRRRERRGSLWFSENTKEKWGERFEKEVSRLRKKRPRKIPQSRFLEALKKRSCERMRLRLDSLKGLVDIPPIPPGENEKKFRIRMIASRARKDSMERIRTRYLSKLNITPRRYQSPPPSTHDNERIRNKISDSGRKRRESITNAAKSSHRRKESLVHFEKTKRSQSSSNSIRHVIRDFPTKKSSTSSTRKLCNTTKPPSLRAFGLGF